MTLSSVISSIKTTLESVNGEVSKQVSQAHLESTVQAAITELKTPTGVIGAVITAADVIFPQSELYRQSAIAALQAVSDLYTAIEGAVNAAAPAPAAS